MEPAAKSCVGLYSTQLKTFLANSKDNQASVKVLYIGTWSFDPDHSAAAGAVLAPRVG
jgi:hypothetical protein